MKKDPVRSFFYSVDIILNDFDIDSDSLRSYNPLSYPYLSASVIIRMACSFFRLSKKTPNDVWTVFNRIQENLTHDVKNKEEDIKLNKQLFNLVNAEMVYA